jgi:hypothetical protein
LLDRIFNSVEVYNPLLFGEVSRPRFFKFGGSKLFQISAEGGLTFLGFSSSGSTSLFTGGLTGGSTSIPGGIVSATPRVMSYNPMEPGSSGIQLGTGSDATYGSGRPDWTQLKDSEKVLETMNALRNASINGEEYINLATYFMNFPNCSSGDDFIGRITIGNNNMDIHMYISYQRPSLVNAGGQWANHTLDFTHGTYVKGYFKTGFWNEFEFRQYVKNPDPNHRGIAKIVFQIKRADRMNTRNIDIFSNYINGY